MFHSTERKLYRRRRKKNDYVHIYLAETLDEQLFWDNNENSIIADELCCHLKRYFYCNDKENVKRHRKSDKERK